MANHTPSKNDLKNISSSWKKRRNMTTDCWERKRNCSFVILSENEATRRLSSNIYKMQLWEISGHAANYEENMFVFEVERQEFGLKPMNCPGHCLMFKHRVQSYRELPLRYADLVFYIAMRQVVLSRG
ncbi:hypothetical protein MLD38_005329 [Melastoma candidum]|uniref:Uncharacterized protein n=1 Tax=Melastoma candidum TaxID=119954 RepID=A0ACB9SBS4_9MYRT|nr:hypothetical protein MLD38_005329 [Melastoma candidum]